MEFSSNDKKWQRFNQKLEKLMKENDFFRLGTTYYEMADFIQNEGGNPSKYKEMGHKMKTKAMIESVKSYMGSGVVEEVEVLAATDSCTFCTSNNGQKQAVKAVKENPLIPNEKCSHKYGCRCVYLPCVTGL